MSLTSIQNNIRIVNSKTLEETIFQIGPISATRTFLIEIGFNLISTQGEFNFFKHQSISNMYFIINPREFKFFLNDQCIKSHLFVNTDNNPSFTSTWETDYKSLFESILSTIRTSWQT